MASDKTATVARVKLNGQHNQVDGCVSGETEKLRNCYSPCCRRGRRRWLRVKLRCTLEVAGWLAWKKTCCQHCNQKRHVQLRKNADVKTVALAKSSQRRIASTGRCAAGVTVDGIGSQVRRAYLGCGECIAPLLEARDDMPGSCVRFAEADVEVELGRDIGSSMGGGRICGPSSIFADQ